MNDNNAINIVIGLSVAEHLSDETNENLLYVGPRFTNDKWHIKTPSIYKFSELLKEVDRRNFTINQIFIFCDIFSLSQFRIDFDCKFNIGKVTAVIGDTHHTEQPLTPLINWLKYNNIKNVALKQTVNQAPIFRDFKFNVICLPYYAHDVTLLEPTKTYIERVLFFGTISERHPRRKELIEYLIKRNLPLDVVSGKREKSFYAYNNYSCSINMPLNKDINYRIYEVMVSGGVCITEKFASSTIGTQIAVNNKNILEYGTFESCYELCCFMLENKSARERLAKQSYESMKDCKSKGLVYSMLKDNNIGKEGINIDVSSKREAEELYKNLEEFERIQNIRAKGHNLLPTQIAKLKHNWKGSLS